MSSTGETNTAGATVGETTDASSVNEAVQIVPKQRGFRLSQRNICDIMNMMEQEPFSALNEGEPANDDDFEDVTEELFKCVDEDLGELELLVNQKTFNWEEVMTSFEVMDHKMDQRMKRNEVIEKKRDLIEELESTGRQPLS